MTEIIFLYEPEAKQLLRHLKELHRLKEIDKQKLTSLWIDRLELMLKIRSVDETNIISKLRSFKNYKLNEIL